MEYQHGEILVSPKTIYWVEMPESIGDHERIELLKKDISSGSRNSGFNSDEFVKRCKNAGLFLTGH